MNKRAFPILVALSLFALLAAAPAYAQGDLDMIKVNIPFRFVVANRTLPASEYFIKRIEPYDPALLQIRSADGRVFVNFVTHGAEKLHIPNQTEIVFNQVAGQRFLSEIWTQGEHLGRELAPSRFERRLAQAAAKQGKRVAITHNVKQHKLLKEGSEG